jgi:hypothetical protein
MKRGAIILKPEDVQHEVSFLNVYDQSMGMDIRNMLDIAESKLNKLLELTGDMPQTEHDKVLNEVFMIITMIRQIRNLTPDELFLSIESILYKMEENN